MLRKFNKSLLILGIYFSQFAATFADSEADKLHDIAVDEALKRTDERLQDMKKLIELKSALIQMREQQLKLLTNGSSAAVSPSIQSSTNKVLAPLRLAPEAR